MAERGTILEDFRQNEEPIRTARSDRVLRYVLLACFLLRIIYSFFIFPVVGERLHWKGVDDGYDEIARNLLDGEGYVIGAGEAPNLVTPPGYVFFLYTLYAITGEEINEGVRIQIVQPLIDTVTCLLIYLLGIRVFADRRVGLLGASAWALYPQVIVYSARVAPETLFIFLLTAMMLALYRVLEKGKVVDAVALGLLWGLAVLVKEKIVFLFPLLILLLFVKCVCSMNRRIRLSLMMVVMMMVTTAPWIVRGYQVTGGFVPITLRSGRALNQGMDESFNGADNLLVDRFESDREWTGKGLPETEEERLLRARSDARDEKSQIGRAVTRISADPFLFLRAFCVKLGAFWYYGQPKVIVGNILIQIPVLLLAICGYIRGWKRHNLMPFLFLTLYFLIIHALTIVRMRYSLPVMPETFLVAAFFLVSFRKRRFQSVETLKHAKHPNRTD